MNKVNGSDGIPVELFQILKDDAVKVLHSKCQQIWKTQQWPQDWKRSIFIPIPKKGNAKECLYQRDDRGWDGWIASLTQWIWVWVNSRSWWWTGRPGILQSMGSQKVGPNWATDPRHDCFCATKTERGSGVSPWPWKPTSKAHFAEGKDCFGQASQWPLE